MQTFTWEHEVVDPTSHDRYLFTYKVGRDIRDALVATGAALDWTDVSTPMAEYGGAGYLHHFSDDLDRPDYVRADSGTAHGWATALIEGLMVHHGDTLRIELTSFDSGQHLLEGWLTSGQGRPWGAGQVIYSAIAHVPADQKVGVTMTREQLRALVADPEAVPVIDREREARDRAQAELRDLRREFDGRARAILERHGLQTGPGPGSVFSLGHRPVGH